MPLVELSDIIKFLDADEEEETKIVSTIQKGAEKAIKNYCHREFEAALYVKERHDGDEQDTIYFNQYPVIAVNLDDLVWNSAGTITRDDGGSFVTDGFVAADKVLVQNSDSNSGLLTIDTGGVAVTVLTFTDTITADTDDDNVILSHFRGLWINDTEIEEDDYAISSDHIYYNPTFTEGHGNVRMTYYAGYSPSSIPNDLQLAVKILTKYFYQKRNEESYGVKDYAIGDIRVAAEAGDFPKEVFALLSQYRRHLI